MTELILAKAFDGEDEIVYCRDYNIFENRLTLEGVYGYNLVLLFENDKTNTETRYKISGEDTKKIAEIKFFNFSNVLGAGTTRKIPLLKFADNSQLLFSLHAKSLNEENSFLNVSLTLYKKKAA